MFYKTLDYPFMYTGYYANLKQYTKNGLVPVSISIYSPIALRNCMDRYEPLMPSNSLLRMYKDGDIDERDYAELYMQSLSGLSRKRVIDDLFNITNNKSPVLLCYEKPSSFCHRHIVSEWLNESGLVSCLEYL